MSVLIGRPINGITINGNEYVCDATGNAIAFEDESAAVEYLRLYGITEKEIDAWGVFFEEADDDEIEVRLYER